MFKKLRTLIMNLFYKEKRTVRDTSEKRSNFIGVVVSDKNDKNTLRVEQHAGFTRVTDLPPKTVAKLNEDGTDPAVNTGYENHLKDKPQIHIILDDNDDVEKVIENARENFFHANPGLTEMVGKDRFGGVQFFDPTTDKKLTSIFEGGIKRDRLYIQGAETNQEIVDDFNKRNGLDKLQPSISTEHSTSRDHMLGAPENVVVARAVLPDLPGDEDCFDDRERTFEVRFCDLPFMIHKGFMKVEQAEQIFIPRGADPALVQEIRDTIALAKGEGLEYVDVHGVVHKPNIIPENGNGLEITIPKALQELTPTISKEKLNPYDSKYEVHKSQKDFFDKPPMRVDLSSALTPETDIHISQVKEVKARLEEPSKNEKRKMSPRRIKKESKKVIKSNSGKHR